VSDDTLVVVQDIPFNNGTVYAYRVGDTVSREVVEANQWEEYVARPATKAAKEATAGTSGSTGSTTKEK